MKWEQRRSGELRFHGKAAMRDMMALLKGDDDYTWTIPTGFCAPFYIDVFPRNIEAQVALLELVDELE